MTEKFQGGFWSSPIIFKSFSQNEVGFREKMGFHRSSSLMHGLIQFVPEERVYVITGRFNWTAIILFLFFIFFATRTLESEGNPFFFAVIPILLIYYIADVYKYRRIAKELAAIRN